MFRSRVLHTAKFQPTPSARRVTPLILSLPPTSLISTHTLRKEGDGSGSGGCRRTINISTHTLRKEGDITSQSYFL